MELIFTNWKKNCLEPFLQLLVSFSYQSVNAASNCILCIYRKNYLFYSCGSPLGCHTTHFLYFNWFPICSSSPKRAHLAHLANSFLQRSHAFRVTSL